jgi:hypothetical protein
MSGPNETVAHIGYYMAVAGRSDPRFSDVATALIHRTATRRPAPLHLLSASATRSAAPYSTPSFTQPARVSPAPSSPGLDFTNDSPRTPHQRALLSPSGLLTTGPAAMSPPIPTTASRNSQRRHHPRFPICASRTAENSRLPDATSVVVGGLVGRSKTWNDSRPAPPLRQPPLRTCRATSAMPTSG